MEEIPGTKLFCWACGEYVPVRYGGVYAPSAEVGLSRRRMIRQPGSPPSK